MYRTVPGTRGLTLTPDNNIWVDVNHTYTYTSYYDNTNYWYLVCLLLAALNYGTFIPCFINSFGKGSETERWKTAGDKWQVGWKLCCAVVERLRFKIPPKMCVGDRMSEFCLTPCFVSGLCLSRRRICGKSRTPILTVSLPSFLFEFSSSYSYTLQCS